jgi:hypothetical protein
MYAKIDEKVYDIDSDRARATAALIAAGEQETRLYTDEECTCPTVTVLRDSGGVAVSRSLGIYVAPYLDELRRRADVMMRRFGGRIELANIRLGRRDQAQLVVVEEPTGLLCEPGLADELDRIYAGAVAAFREDSPGYYWVSRREDGAL